MKKKSDAHKTAAPAAVMVEDVWVVESEEYVDEEEEDNERAQEAYMENLRREYFFIKLPRYLDSAKFKQWCLRRMVANISLFYPDEELTCSTLFGEAIWQRLGKGEKRQISKEFKIGIATKQIRGIMFQQTCKGGLKKKNSSLLYKVLQQKNPSRTKE